MSTLTFYQFSKELLLSGDIDPEYVFIRDFSKHAKMTSIQLLNWIILKLCVYKSASEILIMYEGAKFSDVKYGQERNRCKRYAQYYYETAVEFFKLFPPQRQRNLYNNIGLLPGFGSLWQWKLVDVFDCCMKIDTDLSKIDFRKVYKYPLRGLLMVNDLPEDTNLSDKGLETCLSKAWKLVPQIKKTPHNQNRGVRINELETLLCKYHSYIRGYYYPGKDLENLKKEIHECDAKILKGFKWRI